ncbi:MAG: Asp-tRNA(Asn)/Glu-tRNA(Gln) amidotransferase GatCAB subunit B, partial [Reinekea sp.]|nr:Asp-tRNA(Asn)/Glu-tRNA(Gln) amidotransferase GatCAB subunit B [Reinekea sp.]
EASPITPENLGQLIARIKDNTISGKIAKTVFQAMTDGEGTPDQIIEAKGLKQVTDTGAIEAMVDEVIAANLDQFEEMKAGKDKLMGFFVGQVMKISKGQANPGQVNQIIQSKLKG